MKIDASTTKDLAASLENLAKALNQIAKGLDDQSAPSPAPKKTTLKKKPTKTKQKTAAKKPTKMEVVLQAIRRARKGVDTATLQKRTGFDKRTIRNSIYRLKKENKIKSPAKGIFIKV